MSNRQDLLKVTMIEFVDGDYFVNGIELILHQNDQHL